MATPAQIIERLARSNEDRKRALNAALTARFGEDRAARSAAVKSATGGKQHKSGTVVVAGDIYAGSGFSGATGRVTRPNRQYPRFDVVHFDGPTVGSRLDWLFPVGHLVPVVADAAPDAAPDATTADAA